MLQRSAISYFSERSLRFFLNTVIFTHPYIPYTLYEKRRFNYKMMKIESFIVPVLYLFCQKFWMQLFRIVHATPCDASDELNQVRPHFWALWNIWHLGKRMPRPKTIFIFFRFSREYRFWIRMRHINKCTVFAWFQ